MKQIRNGIFAVWVLVFALTGCGTRGETQDMAEGSTIFYLNEAEDGFVRKPYTGDAVGEDLIEEYLECFVNADDISDGCALLPEGVSINGYTVGNGLLTLDFSPSYEKMDSVREVLARAGIVRTMVQADTVERVRFTVDGEDAVSPDGVALGIMNANSFVEDAGKQINTIQNTTINLYYANEAGKALHAEGRSIYYSASKPLEWAIVERVIAGPKESGNYPTVPTTTQIINVSSANGICYVNLTQAFESNALTNLSPEIPIYSIVNSLLARCEGIEAVQISIEGESDRDYQGKISLREPFTQNFLLVEDKES